MGSTRRQTIGQGAANFVDPHAILQYQSIVNNGDGASSGTTNYTDAQIVLWGWSSAGNRLVPLYSVGLGLLPRHIEVARGIVHLGLIGKQLTSTPPSITIPVHEIEGVLGTGTSATLRATGVPWYGSDFGPAPGFDYDATPLDAKVLDSSAITALGGAPGNPVRFYADLDVTGALQRARDELRNMDLVFPVTLTKPVTSTAHYIGFDKASGSTFDDAVHTFVEVFYWPRLAIFTAALGLDGNPPDFTQLHDPAAAGTNNRTYLGAVQVGATSSPKKYWAWNMGRGGPRRDVIVGTGRAEATPIDNSGAAGGRNLRAVRVYDWNGSNEGSDSGDFQIEPQSGTTYKLAFTSEAGVTSYLNDSVSGSPTVGFNADHSFKNPAGTKVVITIETARFSTTTGWSTNDRITWSVRGDRRTTEAPETLSLVEIMPALGALDGPDGNTANTARARELSHAFSAQIINASNETISAVSRGHIEVPDTSHVGWGGVGSKVTLFTPGGDLVIDDLEILEVAPSGYADEIRMNRVLTGPEIAALNSAGHITGGVYLGAFAAFQIRRLSSAIAAGAESIPLDAAFDDGNGTPAQPGRVVLVDESGTVTASEVVDVASGLSTLVPQNPTTNGYSLGSLVFLVVDQTVNPAGLAGRPFWVRGDLPNDTDIGRKSGFYDVFEQTTV